MLGRCDCLSLLDAYQLISQTSRATIANAVDPNYAVVARVRKRFLPPTSWMQGAHARLRDLGNAALAERS